MRKIEKYSIASCVILILHTVAAACRTCRAQVSGGIYDQDFFLNLFVVLLPVVLLTAIGIGLYQAETIRRKWRETGR